MSEQNPIKAEIKDGKLIIGSNELNLEGLQILASDDKPKNIGADLQELFASFSIISSLIKDAGPSGNVDGEILTLNLPSYNSLYALKLVADSLKKM